ncbi:60S ribosomal protein L10A [Gurleya vavrai]
MNPNFTKEKLVPLFQQATLPENKTIDCQITLKNYDFKKDVRFDSNVLLPHYNRKNPKILVLADKNLEQLCKDEKYEFVMLDDIQGAHAEKKKIKKKLAKKYNSFISIPAFNKAFEMRILACKNKPVYTIKSVNELKSVYDNVCRTVKFKLRKSVNLGFAVGSSEMSVEDLSENLSVAMNHLIGILKKGMQNIKSVYIKNNQGKAIKVF